MRQVPHYLIIGNGRVAKHFLHYFKLLKLSVAHWHRALPTAILYQMCSKASHILVLISDPYIDEIIKTHQLAASSRIVLHFSGSILSQNAWGAHPLMCFSQELYDIDTYTSIPFVIDQQAPAFETLLPGLNNPHARLDPKLKPLYHALCVLSANFSCLLWQNFFSSLENKLHLSPELGFPILQRQTLNLLADSQHALSGPLIRKDHATLAKHIAALEGDPFQQIYHSFVNCYEEMENLK